MLVEIVDRGSGCAGTRGAATATLRPLQKHTVKQLFGKPQHATAPVPKAKQQCTECQIQHLLLRLGMISRIKKAHFNYRDGRDGYQLLLTFD